MIAATSADSVYIMEYRLGRESACAPLDSRHPIVSLCDQGQNQDDAYNWKRGAYVSRGYSNILGYTCRYLLHEAMGKKAPETLNVRYQHFASMRLKI